MLDFMDVIPKVNYLLLESEEIPYILRVVSTMEFNEINFVELIPVDIVGGKDVTITEEVLKDIDFILEDLSISYELDYNDHLEAKTITIRC